MNGKENLCMAVDKFLPDKVYFLPLPSIFHKS